MMIQFISRKKTQPQYKLLDKVAIQWAKDGIDTLQKAGIIQTSENCYMTQLLYLNI